MGGSGRGLADLTWPGRVQLNLFEWRGTIHAYVERVGSTPTSRVPRRLRLASRTWPETVHAEDERAALVLVRDWLTEILGD